MLYRNIKLLEQVYVVLKIGIIRNNMLIWWFKLLEEEYVVLKNQLIRIRT